jgi:hypothetical protein
MIRTRIDRRQHVTVLKTTEPQKVDYKPIGFWYSVDRDWERWCEGEMPDALSEHFVHSVDLGSEHLLEIQNVDEIDAFHLQYSVPLLPGTRLQAIDWKRVSSEFDGIEIAPYLWERRHNGDAHHWYYGWDCASGCIWRPEGIIVTLTKEPVLKSCSGS